MFDTMRIRSLAVAAALALCTVAAGAAAQQTGIAPAGQRVLSPRDTARMELGAGKHLFIDYGRPSARGRRIMGELVPFGRVWRTGANAATTLVTDVDLLIGDARVPRGTYTLYTLPSAGEWKLIVNRQTGQWGTQYDPGRDLVRIPLRKESTRTPVERFTIALEPGRAATHTLALAWENTRLTVPVRVAPPAPPRGR